VICSLRQHIYLPETLTGALPVNTVTLNRRHYVAVGSRYARSTLVHGLISSIILRWRWYVQHLGFIYDVDDLIFLTKALSRRRHM